MENLCTYMIYTCPTMNYIIFRKQRQIGWRNIQTCTTCNRRDFSNGRSSKCFGKWRLQTIWTAYGRKSQLSQVNYMRWIKIVCPNPYLTPSSAIHVWSRSKWMIKCDLIQKLHLKTWSYTIPNQLALLPIFNFNFILFL